VKLEFYLLNTLKIKDSVETTDSPFEKESVFLSGETRREQWRKKGTYRR